MIERFDAAVRVYEFVGVKNLKLSIEGLRFRSLKFRVRGSECRWQG